MKKTLNNYKRYWKKEIKGESKQFRKGLKLGLLGSTNNKKIRKWIKEQKV